MPRLTNWAVVMDHDPYKAPELRNHYLTGLVSGSNKFPEGSDIRTTSIRGKFEGKVVTLSGSEYELGDPHPDYLKEYPNAKERLLSHLPEITKHQHLAHHV